MIFVKLKEQYNYMNLIQREIKKNGYLLIDEKEIGKKRDSFLKVKTDFILSIDDNFNLLNEFQKIQLGEMFLNKTFELNKYELQQIKKLNSNFSYKLFEDKINLLKRQLEPLKEHINNHVNTQKEAMQFYQQCKGSNLNNSAKILGAQYDLFLTSLYNAALNADVQREEDGFKFTLKNKLNDIILFKNDENKLVSYEILMPNITNKRDIFLNSLLKNNKIKPV